MISEAVGAIRAEAKRAASAMRERNANRSPSRVRTCLPGFEAFWSAYPKKQGRVAAAGAWRRLAPENGLAEQILAAIERQTTWSAWQRDGGRLDAEARASR